MLCIVSLLYTDKGITETGPAGKWITGEGDDGGP